MSTTQLNRALWLVDLLRRYGRLTRADINRHWRRTSFSEGKDIPRRTFFNYREEVESIFNIRILCDPNTYEYYLEEDDHARSMTNWIVHSSELSQALSDSREVAQSIFLEDIPSARDYLSLAVEALKEKQCLRFDYAPYTRSTPTRDVVVEPYFLKLFKQRWYLTGRVPAEKTIKTYALDRMLTPVLTGISYTIPDDFDAESYFRDSFGIIFTRGDVKNVMLKVDSRQAKYFRALPLHHSQQELIHDTYSIFTYRLKITPDFIQELLSHGSSIMVMQPPELRAMVVNELRTTLARYD